MCGANMGQDRLASVKFDWLTLSSDGYVTRWRPDGEWGWRCRGMGNGVAPGLVSEFSLLHCVGHLLYLVVLFAM